MPQPAKSRQLETVKATLECARADVEAEDDRMKVLDGKLGTLATLSGLSVSISASLGATVLASGRLGTWFTLGLGLALGVAVVMLLRTVLAAFRGLRPKEYRGITLAAAEARVTPRRLALPPEDALAILAATYYTDILPAARSANNVKLGRVTEAFAHARVGLSALIAAVLVTAVGAVV